MANGTSGTSGGGKVSAGGGGGGVTVFSQLTDEEGNALLNSHNDVWQGNADVANAIGLYASNTNPNGDGYSHSQNLNYKLDQGKALNATEKQIDIGIQKGMQPIGKNVNLVRYCHDDILKQLGVSDYSKFSENELKSKLVGATFTTKSYMSTSYNANKSPFAPGAIAGGGREVVMQIKAKGSTKFVPGDKSQAELVLNKGSKVKVSNIYYDGTKAYPNSIYPKSKPRVVLEIEIE